MRSSGGQKIDKNDGEEFEDVSDDEFDKLTAGWEKNLDKIDYSLKTSKQRKQQKKRTGEEELDLDDEEVDLGDLYDGESSEGEDFGGDDFGDFQGLSDDDELEGTDS